MPASLGAPDDGADAPAVRHPVVQRGDYRRARPAVPRVRHQALHRAVRARALLAEDEYRVAVEHTQLFLEGRNDELRRDAARPDDGRRRRPSASSRRRSCATRSARSRRSRTRQQKMASAELGDRDAFGLKVGPAGAVVQVFQMRGGRVVERIELVTDGASARPRRAPRPIVARAATSCRRRCSSSTPIASPPPEDAPAGRRSPRPTPRCSKGGCRRRPAAACGSSCRSAARSAACSISPRATPSSPTRRASTRTSPRNYDALETLRAVLALPAVPRRIECFDISTIQGSETVASMVVCEDGRMKRSEYRKFRIRGAGLGARDSGLGETRCRDRPSAELRAAEPRAAEPRAAIHDDFASMHEVVLRRYRKLLESGRAVPRSDPDRRRQGAAVGRLRGARGARARATSWRSASPRRRSCCSRATARTRSRCRARARRCC